MKRPDEASPATRPAPPTPSVEEERKARNRREVVELFAVRLSDSDKRIRRQAARDMVRVGPEGVAKLLSVYTGASEDIADAVRLGLRASDEESVPVLLRTIRYGTPPQRELAGSIISRFKSASTREALLSFILADDPDVVRAALKALADSRYYVRAATVIPFTRNRDPKVRSQAARVLGREQPSHVSGFSRREGPVTAEEDRRASFEALIPLLGDEDSSVRAAAACGIGFQNSSAGIDLLIPLLADSVPEIQSCARRSMYRLDRKWFTRTWAKEILSDIIILLGSPGRKSRLFALEYLPRIDPGWQRGAPAEKAVAALSIQLRTGNDSERHWAASALGQIALPSAGRPLADALLDENQNVQLSALKAVINVGDPALEHLMRNLGKGPIYSQVRTIAALQEITGLSFEGNTRQFDNPEKWKEWWREEQAKKAILTEGP